MSWANRIGSLFALLTLSIPAVAGAQHVEGGGAQTLLGGGVSHGGFGAVHLRAGEVVDERSLFMGGEAAWVANQRLILGVGAWALVSKNARIVASSGGVDEGAPLRMGYAGVLVGYRIAPTAIVHPTASMLIGAGGTSIADSQTAGDDDDAFFVAEPALGVELNVASFLRLGVGASYRWVAGVELGGLRDEDLSGLTCEFSLRLGRF
jgi:hypothetical protein